MNKKQKYYQVSRQFMLLIWVVYVGIFVIGILTTGPGDTSDFMENPIVMKVIAVCIFAFGLHSLVFMEESLKEHAAWWDRFLAGKPRFVQSLLGFRVEYPWTRPFYYIVAALFMIFGAAFFVFANTR